MTTIDTNRKWTQDEIINNTRNVVRGLETLKTEHSGILDTLLCHEDEAKGEEKSDTEQEKAHIVQESMEKIDLGLGEAQVAYLLCVICHHNCYV